MAVALGAAVGAKVEVGAGVGDWVTTAVGPGVKDPAGPVVFTIPGEQAFKHARISSRNVIFLIWNPMKPR
jgi:hypothetical protein